MQLEVKKPELAKWVDDKVKSGDFPSPEAVVEDALSRMMLDELVLTDEDIAAINAADDEIDRGDYVDFDEFAARMRQRFQSK